MICVSRLGASCCAGHQGNSVYLFRGDFQGIFNGESILQPSDMEIDAEALAGKAYSANVVMSHPILRMLLLTAMGCLHVNIQPVCTGVDMSDGACWCAGYLNARCHAISTGGSLGLGFRDVAACSLAFPAQDRMMQTCGSCGIMMLSSS